MREAAELPLAFVAAPLAIVGATKRNATRADSAHKLNATQPPATTTTRPTRQQQKQTRLHRPAPRSAAIAARLLAPNSARLESLSRRDESRRVAQTFAAPTADNSHSRRARRRRSCSLSWRLFARRTKGEGSQTGGAKRVLLLSRAPCRALRLPLRRRAEADISLRLLSLGNNLRRADLHNSHNRAHNRPRNCALVFRCCCCCGRNCLFVTCLFGCRLVAPTCRGNDAVLHYIFNIFARRAQTRRGAQQQLAREKQLAREECFDGRGGGGGLVACRPRLAVGAGLAARAQRPPAKRKRKRPALGEQSHAAAQRERETSASHYPPDKAHNRRRRRRHSLDASH